MKYPSMSITVPTDPRHPGHLRTDDAPPPYIPATPIDDPYIKHPTVAHMRETIASIRAGNIADMRSRGAGKGAAGRDPRRGLLSREIGRRYTDGLDWDEVVGMEGMEGRGEGGW